MLQKEQGCWGEKKKGREEEKGRKNERMKKRNGGARRAVDVTRMEQHRRFRYIRRVSLFPTRRSHRRDVYRVFFFFFSPPLPDETHLRYCLSALRNEGEGDTSKEEKDWDGKYGGNMNHDESSRERLLSSNSITSVKYILSNNRGRMVKSFNHTKWNGWETGEIYEIRVEILWKWEIQLFAMACN